MNLPELPPRHSWRAEIADGYVAVKLYGPSPGGYSNFGILASDSEEVGFRDPKDVIIRCAKRAWRRYSESLRLSRELGIEVTSQ